jgi:glycosyltransferase involved in cell wall biosynthesis
MIDGRFIGIGDSIGRYVLELLREILKTDSNTEYTLLIRPAGGPKVKAYFETLPENLKVKELDIPHYSFAEQTTFLEYLNKEKFDLVHFTQFNHPIFYSGKFVTTIHDLILLKNLNLINWPKQLIFRMVMRDAVKRSVKVIAISEFAKKAVEKAFGKSKKIEVVYHGVDHTSFRQNIEGREDKIAAFKEHNLLDGEYLLYTGAWKKHKNLIRLFAAFEKYFIQKSETSKAQLVLVGKQDNEEPEVLAEIVRINNLSSKIIGKKAILAIGSRYGEELTTAYAGALAYIIPSLAEGFGWPPLEAMACGTAVLAAKTSCIPEVLGDAPYYFDPYSVESIHEAIEKVLLSESVRATLIEKGLIQAAKYDWRETARKTLDIYNLD